jgi:hypothetical protein
MSYEQKYLKYKNKYQELKKSLNGKVHSLETENNFVLTDTPTFNQMGAGYDDNLILTETPTMEQSGGYAPVSFTASGSCGGIVNTPPVTTVPIIPQTPAVDRKNLSLNNDIITTTTEVGELRNTVDIENLFNQLGGKKSKRSKSKKDSESTTQKVVSSNIFDSSESSSDSSNVSSSDLSSLDTDDF